MGAVCVQDVGCYKCWVWEQYMFTMVSEIFSSLLNCPLALRFNFRLLPRIEGFLSLWYWHGMVNGTVSVKLFSQKHEWLQAGLCGLSVLQREWILASSSSSREKTWPYEITILHVHAGVCVFAHLPAFPYICFLVHPSHELTFETVDQFSLKCMWASDANNMQQKQH
jgi:hypothetical protein